MKRAVRTLIRLVAAGFVIFGGMEIGLEVTRQRLQHSGLNGWHYLIGSILIVIGIALFAVSSWLAEQLTDDID